MNSMTLDGVMQAPARPDEDTRDGFDRGGWAIGYQDEVHQREMGKGMAGPPPELVFGRRTYEDFFSVWPKRTGDPVSALLDNLHKYVASRTLSEPLPWQNSTLLQGDAADAVAELKRTEGPDLMIMGSGDLIQSLRRRDLIDAYQLLVHPTIFGKGRRMFPDGCAPSDLRLVDTVVTTTGVIMTRYEPAGRS
jgi:dihydrofolate reductase